METIRIPNTATYAPFALSDVIMAAPLASRLLLGATVPGRIVQMAAIGYYAGSALADWAARQGARKVDFIGEYGGDVFDLVPQPDESRASECRDLAARLNDGFVAEQPPRAEVAKEVNEHLTHYISSVTGQRVETSDEVRGFNLAGLIFPFAQGTCDILSGDIAILRDTGVFEPHIITHEFTHRKGYWKELHAQALAYFALRASGVPYLIQSARAERLHRQLRALTGEDRGRYDELLIELDLRPELKGAFEALRPPKNPATSMISEGMKKIYDERMKATGQNGLSDYDVGFTNLLYTFSISDSARQPKVHAAA